MVKTRTPKVTQGTIIVRGRSIPAHKMSGEVYFRTGDGVTLTAKPSEAATFVKEKK